MYDVFDLRELLPAELAQQREAGHDVAGLDEVVSRALAEQTEPRSARLRELYDTVRAAPRMVDCPYDEPSIWSEIEARLPAASVTPVEVDDAVFDHLHGAWLGRCAGCTLGKPVEGFGWTRERIKEYLTLAGAHPLRDYIPALDPTPHGWHLNPLCWQETTLSNVAGMARDDDIDYTILALHVLEKYGFGFGPADVATEWLDRIPFTQTYTAERAAYRNLVCGRYPPLSATVDNPYREWIGAQIRADMWGYVCPGDPCTAARLAFADASLSHTANGTYGAMWVAALLAVAATTTDVRAALLDSLDHVPDSSRLSEALRHVLALHEKGISWDAARDEVEARFGRYSWLHTVNNAANVALALLWGADDFSRTIGLAVEGGWDTDCNGATAGSVFGVMHGVSALPAHWVDPLQDRARSAISGYHSLRISELARRTLHMARARLDR